jgi:CheY-like chemotaxis protein
MPHIIIVEEEETLRKLFKIIIRRISPSYTVSTASNGKRALQAYKKSGADLIISNYKMPVMTGPDLVRTLRARGLTLPIVMASADPGAEKECYEAGATLFVQKTDLVRELPAILSRFLPQ